MGKATGFLEYTRQNNYTAAPQQRIKNWQEFQQQISTEERRKQGARCMDCGVPFCQSGMKLGGAYTGCPLHNLVPEWNDLIYTGNIEQALERLQKTNNFPEFTGRVCPALCEAACVCGVHGDPVTVRANELSVIEEGFKKGYIKARIPQHRSGKSVAIVGSGPAGLAAADLLNQRGHSVAVFERDDRIGGLLTYGIPNMKLDKRYVRRRVQLLEEEGITFLTGIDVGRDISAQELTENYDAVLIAVGARKPRDLQVPGRQAAGVYFAMEYLSGVTRSYLDSDFRDGNYISAEGKDVVIIGGGDTGNDCVATAVRQGCSSVCQVEMFPQNPAQRAANNPWPQWPRVDKLDYGQQEAVSVFGADPRLFTTTVKEVLADGEGKVCAVKIVTLECSGKDAVTGRPVMAEVPGSERELPCQLLLLAMGFVGAEEYVAEAFGIETEPCGNIKTTDYAADKAGIFAAGDARRGQSLVVWAIQEGRSAAREIDRYLMGYTSL